MSMNQYEAPPPMSVVPKSTAAALLIGLLLPGVGNMYAGRPGKGLLIIAVTIFLWAVAALTLGFGGIFVLGCYVWGPWTAHNDAVRWNRAHGIIS